MKDTSSGSGLAALSVLGILLGVIFILPIVLWIIWGWVIGAPLVNLYTKLSPDWTVERYQCGASDYHYEVVSRDAPETPFSLLPIPYISHHLVPVLKKGNIVIAESDVFGYEPYGKTNSPTVTSLVNFDLAESGSLRTYVMSPEIQASLKSDASQRIYRGLIINSSDMPFNDLGLVVRCFQSNQEEINKIIEPVKKSSDHLDYYYRLGWIAYTGDNVEGQSEEKTIILP